MMKFRDGYRDVFTRDIPSQPAGRGILVSMVVSGAHAVMKSTNKVHDERSHLRCGLTDDEPSKAVIEAVEAGHVRAHHPPSRRLEGLLPTTGCTPTS